MEKLREKLNYKLEDDNISLSSKEIVMLSQKLDKLICRFYENNNEYYNTSHK